MFLTLEDIEIDADYSNIQVGLTRTRFEDFRDKREKELLIKILGQALYTEFVAAYNEAYPDYLDQLADKWKRILNGAAYTRADVSYTYVGLKEILKPYIYATWNHLTMFKRVEAGLIKSKAENSQVSDDEAFDIVRIYNIAINYIGRNCHECDTFLGMMHAYKEDYPTWRFTVMDRMSYL